MRIVKVGVLAPTNKGIPLGVQGENRATQVEFDTRPWFREYPYGTVSAVARRDGDPATYPLSLDVADGTAVWRVSDTDTAKAGEGAVELTMTSAGARVRSLTFKTLVTASLTDSPVDDDAWYGWLDKAVVKVDETVQSAKRKMGEVEEEWTSLKADVTAKVEECGDAAAQAATDAHHAKVDAQATAKALESAEGSVAKAEAAANRAVDAALAADDSAVEASRSALSAGESAESAAGSATNAETSASEAATSASNAVDAASAASGSASAAAQSATDANSAKVAAQTAKDEAATSASNAATSESNAASSATAAEKSASDAAASVDEMLNEAKQYTDANTSNALVGTVSGKLLHVEDAWPGKPLSLTIDGACKQDGTPSPESPVPIAVVDNPVLKVTGADTSAEGASLQITLPAEHPYLAALPDGTHDEIVIDKDGNASLVARVLRLTVPDGTSWNIQSQVGGFALGYTSDIPGFAGIKKDLYAASLMSDRFESRHDWENNPCFGVSGVLWVVPRINQNDITPEDVAAVADGMKFYAPLITPVTYSLGKLDLPSLPETISNVWIEETLTPNASMTYKRDINIAFDNLVQAVVAAAAGE